MNRIIVKSGKDMDRIADWAMKFLNAHPSPDDPVAFAPPFESGEVIFEGDSRLEFKYEGNGNTFFRTIVLESGRELGTFRFNYSTMTVSDKWINSKYVDPEKAARLEKENRVFQTYGAKWFMLMLFAVYYRPEVEKRMQVTGERRTAGKKNKKGGKSSKPLYVKTYVIDGDLLDNLPKAPRKHGKPGHEYGVRGHYRHYKSGKVAWIKPQTRCKGRGKAVDSVYVAKMPQERKER